MKKTILFFLTFLLSVSYAQIFAQNEAIKQIREHYGEVKQHIAERAESEGYAPIYLHTVQNQSMVPGVGIQETTTKFYYYSGETPRCEGFFEDDLVKVEVSFSVAMSADYYYEYLFDIQGNLIFSYMKANKIACVEERFYFSEEKLIKLKTNPLSGGCENEAEQIAVREAVSDFSRSEQNRANQLLEKAAQYQEIFAALIQTDNVEKGTWHLSPDMPCPEE